jgi:hypothetical protein
MKSNKPIGMGLQELSRTEFWRALSSQSKRVMTIYFEEPGRTLVEAVVLSHNRHLYKPMPDGQAGEIADNMLKNVNVQAIVELRAGTHKSQQPTAPVEM